MNRLKGFTLIELMIVIAIIAFLSMVSIPSFMKFLSKAKRTEAYINLGSLYIAEKAYWAEHGKYSKILRGQGGIGWQPEGYVGGGKQERFYYTYGFADGQEGTSLFTGKLETPASALMQTQANDNAFVIAAAADIDGDGVADVLTINQNNEIKLMFDDLS
jgi:type IV pilus assembly protein PilA